jgi:pyruvate kinase
VSKIERTEAIENLEEIVEASDVVMVARGDLGVEIGDAELPGLQKKIIKASLAQNKVVITATQMLQSMVESPIRPAPKCWTWPTRSSTVPMR